MERVLPAARWTILVGLSAAVAGIAVLFVQALTEVLTDPALSLADGYRIGRLPWTAVGVDLAVIGASIAVVSGTVTAWLSGGAIRRMVTAVALAVAGCWWFVAMLPPPQGAFCASCAPPGPDPMTMAYSLPEAAALFLLLPAVIAGAVGLGARRTRAPVAADAAVA